MTHTCHGTCVCGSPITCTVYACPPLKAHATAWCHDRSGIEPCGRLVGVVARPHPAVPITTSAGVVS